MGSILCQNGKHNKRFLLGALLSPWRWSVPPKYECLNSCGSWNWDQGQVFWVVQLSFSIWSLSISSCVSWVPSFLRIVTKVACAWLHPEDSSLPHKLLDLQILPFVHLLDLMGGGLSQPFSRGGGIPSFRTYSWFQYPSVWCDLRPEQCAN